MSNADVSAAGTNPSRTSRSPHAAHVGSPGSDAGPSSGTDLSTYVSPAHSAINHLTKSSDTPDAALRKP